MTRYTSAYQNESLTMFFNETNFTTANHHFRDVCGWTVCYQDDNSDDDVRKLDFAIRNEETGEAHDLDHSPYEWPNAGAIVAYVALEFPRRKGLGPWRNETIIAELMEVTKKARSLT